MAKSQQMTHEEHHRALVQRLASELKPARRIWPVGMRLALWMVLEIAILVWVLAGHGSALIGRLKQPGYAMEVLSFGLAAVVLSALALRSAIPGRQARTAELTLAGLLVLTGTLLIGLALPMDTSPTLGEFVSVGVQCALRIGLYAALPLAAIWWMVMRGAPMRSGLSGLLAGGGATLFAFAILRFECPIDEPLHIITWHLLPALGLIGLSALAGAKWLKFRLRSR
jgi:hypothetical protein